MKPLMVRLVLLTMIAVATFAEEVVTFTVIDRVQFTVPGNWLVLTSKSTPEKTVFAFQIPNPADMKTHDSTNLVIVSSYLKDSSEKEAFDKKASSADNGAVEKRLVDGWQCRTFTGMQDKTEYVDWDCYRVLTDCGVFVRMAWPHLPKNPKGYDTQMETALSKVLTSVEPSKKPQGPDIPVYRPSGFGRGHFTSFPSNQDLRSRF